MLPVRQGQLIISMTTCVDLPLLLAAGRDGWTKLVVAICWRNGASGRRKSEACARNSLIGWRAKSLWIGRPVKIINIAVYRTKRDCREIILPPRLGVAGPFFDCWLTPGRAGRGGRKKSGIGGRWVCLVEICWRFCAFLRLPRRVRFLLDFSCGR